MSPQEQQNVFTSALTETLEKDCSYDVVQAVHEQLRGRIQEHKESRDPEPLTLSVREVGTCSPAAACRRRRWRPFRTSAADSTARTRP